MLVIRKAQMEALEADMRERFVRQTRAHLVETKREHASRKRPGELDALIRDAWSRARRFGIETSRGVRAFATLDLVLGPPFESAPGQQWALRILQNTSMDGEEKISLICQRLALDEKRRNEASA